MFIINPQMEEYTAQLDGGEIEIDGTKYLYEAMTITSKLLEEYLKEQEIILDIHNISIPCDAIHQIELNNSNQKGTEIIFELMTHKFRHFGILGEFTLTFEPPEHITVTSHYNRVDTDMKFSIGLAGSHINKELHKLIILMNNKEK